MSSKWQFAVAAAGALLLAGCTTTGSGSGMAPSAPSSETNAAAAESPTSKPAGDLDVPAQAAAAPEGSLVASGEMLGTQWQFAVEPFDAAKAQPYMEGSFLVDTPATLTIHADRDTYGGEAEMISDMRVDWVFDGASDLCHYEFTSRGVTPQAYCMLESELMDWHRLSELGGDGATGALPPMKAGESLTVPLTVTFLLEYDPFWHTYAEMHPERPWVIDAYLADLGRPAGFGLQSLSWGDDCDGVRVAWKVMFVSAPLNQQC